MCNIGKMPLISLAPKRCGTKQIQEANLSQIRFSELNT